MVRTLQRNQFIGGNYPALWLSPSNLVWRLNGKRIGANVWVGMNLSGKSAVGHTPISVLSNVFTGRAATAFS